MKTFAYVLLMAGFAAAKDLPPTETPKDEPKKDKDGNLVDTTDADADADADAGVEPDLTPEQEWELYWANFDDRMLMARMAW